MRDHGGERTEKRELVEREKRDKKIKKGKGGERERETERETQTGKGGYLSFSSRRGLMAALCASVKRSINIMACWMLGLCGPAHCCCYNGRQAVLPGPVSVVTRIHGAWTRQK